MRTILILMDSLNRHSLNAYVRSEVKTPNIDRLARRSTVFDRHYCGSMPCMPARRELWTGRLNFLETPWSPLQPFDECLPDILREQKGTYSHLITDHYHYFERNGLAYPTNFDTWEFIRGQEGDPWHPSVGDPKVPEYRGKNRRQDWVNRTFMDLERDEDYPTPRCFIRAMDYLENNHAEDNWHLHLEVFDPHEPFICPSDYRESYGDKWNAGYLFDWPSYAPVDPEKEGPEAIEHIRKSYGATLTMADSWLGKFLNKMDAYDMWKDTTVILTSDHGYLLGDHGYWAKNYMFDYKELAHIPLIVASPESTRAVSPPPSGEAAVAGKRRVSALTATIDLMPTLLELHGATPSANVHGRSLAGLLRENSEPGIASEAPPHHDALLYGYFGKDVNMTDGRYIYCRQPEEGAVVHHHTAAPYLQMKHPGMFDEAETGRFLPQTKMPVYRVPTPSIRHQGAPEEGHLLYDTANDPDQRRPVNDPRLEAEMEAKLVELLQRYDAPPCQYDRLGLARPKKR